MLRRLTSVVDARLDWLGIWTLLPCVGLWGKIFKWRVRGNLSLLALPLPAWSGGARAFEGLVAAGPLRALALPLLAQSGAGLHGICALPAAAQGMLWPCTPRHGPGLLPAPYGTDGGPGTFSGPGGMGSHRFRPLCMEPLVGPAAVIWQCMGGPGEGGSCGKAMEMLTPQVCTPERARAWSWRDRAVHIIAVGPRGQIRMEWGVWTLILVMAGWLPLLSVFYKREWLGAGEFPASPNWATF